MWMASHKLCGYLPDDIIKRKLAVFVRKLALRHDVEKNIS